ncbi:Peptidase M61 domain protein [Croceitalea dokdonensis DOKDO 023]|uniref:Peptidase M61 domain protein n=1 Tax=Croceitalea dokdonensis DOKDO 023 TaxID=1300341 RepID=A0A0P7AZL2_9FLAO|nr:PDZ domain-containing protein [Croceitalea dokdonensis]KPM33738.1 Peptidase M61 domain protein [Croceitalea dokdonensis DOKDO 023]
MRLFFILTVAVFPGLFCLGQTNTYTISFNNAVHHEGRFQLHFPKIEVDTLVLRMANSSPGRYAFHSFAKNIYSVTATNINGDTLTLHRPNPYEWRVPGHQGEVTISYTLFANRGDGTFSQIDETHAHLNIPASFMYAPSLSNRPIEVKVEVPENSNWQVATQLKQLKDNTFWAPNLYYFMDSPMEISNFQIREFPVDNQTIRFALHHQGTQEELDVYFKKIQKIVLEQKTIFGELPKFDFGTYTFLACYMPQVNGDGMEHRNSTILTNTRSLAGEGMERNLGTVSHEFFHAWNVERIRPKSLEPFDFEQVDMSGELWFAEGFTSYYTNLVLCRAGLMTPEAYIKSLNGTFNYVWNSPGTQFYNPIEMSYQAPFVDAATSLDPQNRNNTFISYYSYGSVLGLALDLTLRQKGLNLDDFFKQVWLRYGKTEKPYTVSNLEEELQLYAGKELATDFFGRYIYDSQMPDYGALLASVGLVLGQGQNTGYFGASVNENIISGNTIIHGPAYQAGLEKGDRLLSVNNKPLSSGFTFSDYLTGTAADEVVTLTFERFGKERQTMVTLAKDPTYTIEIGEKIDKKTLEARKQWLKQ